MINENIKQYIYGVSFLTFVYITLGYIIWLQTGGFTQTYTLFWLVYTLGGIVWGFMFVLHLYQITVIPLTNLFEC